MSLESFLGFDQGEGMSESAFEAFKERMAAAQAQIAAIKKEERKQRKKEDELLKILLHFVKTSHKRELVLLISRVLEQNVPANFVLAMILLGNEDVQKLVGQFLMITGNEENEVKLIDGNTEDHALVFFDKTDESLPLKIKIEIDNWIKNMLFQAEETPEKIIRSAYKIEMIELPREYDFDDPKYEQIKKIHPSLSQLAAFIIRDFLEQNKISEPYDKLYNFAKFIIEGILNKTAENYENRGLLGN